MVVSYGFLAGYVFAVLLCALVCSPSLRSCLLLRTAKSWTNLLGFVQFVWHVVQVLRHWGRFPWWGGRPTPRYHGPLGRLSKRRQGGPWAPPPCSVNSPGNLLMTMPGCCLGSSGCCLFSVERLFFPGSVSVFLFVEPFHDPTGVCCLIACPLRSFLCLVLSSTPCLSLCLSLSLSLSFPHRRWGNPNLFGLGFPLCSRGHDLLLRPVPRGRHLHQGFRPHLLFFCFSTSLVFLVVGVACCV